jgi:hypothetical protein
MGTLFKPASHKRIPTNGVTPYMEFVWVCHLPSIFNHLLTSPTVGLGVQEPAHSNKVFDWPAQSELLAQLCCDDIAKAALDIFNEQARSVRRSVKAGNVVEGGGGLTTRCKEATLSSSQPSQPFDSR